MKCQIGKMVSLQNGKLAKWKGGKTEKNGQLTKWQIGKTPSWQNGNLKKWQIHQMVC